MAKLPRSLIALPVRWWGPCTATVNDGGGIVSVNVIPSGVLWTRTFLASASATGASEADPKDLIAVVDAQLSSYFRVELAPTGRVRITSLASETQQSLVWGEAARVGRALGFSTSLEGVYPGESREGDTLPAYCWFPYALTNDSGFRAEPSTLVTARRASGLVDAWDEGVLSVERTFRADYAPSDESTRVARGLNATPFWPPKAETSRWFTPTIDPLYCPNAWTVHETLACAAGLRVAYAIGDLQELIAGASTQYFVGAFDPDSLRARNDRSALSLANYQSLTSVPSFTLTRAHNGGSESR